MTALAAATLEIATVEEWIDAAARCAGEVRQANPDVRVAVTLGSTGPHAEELFRRLRAADSPADAVGLSISPRGRTAEEVHAHLGTLSRWLERHPGPRPVRVLQAGASPFTTGGDLGQWRFLRSVLAFAARHGLRGVSIEALADRRSSRGLLAAGGRRRLAFDEIQALLQRAAAPPPK